MTSPSGPLVIVSGPSGSGKSTLIAGLLADPPVDLRLSVSATTRGRRPNEQDGVHYHFWERPRFEAALAAGEFLEWAEVYGNYYGTLRSEVEPFRARGVCVLLDVDTQGAIRVWQLCPDAVGVFIRTATLDELERRLRARHRDRGGHRPPCRRRPPRVGAHRQVSISSRQRGFDRRPGGVPGHCAARNGKEQGLMLDDLKEEAIVNKVGGRFKLSTLIQKRMVALNTGAKPLVDVRGADKMAIVVQEILQDKIYLDANNQVQARGTSANEAMRRAMATDISDAGGGED